MRTRASVLRHPLHPALVHFPIGLLAGAAVADLAATLGAAVPWSVGGYLLAAGLVTGVVSALPGIIDLVATVWPTRGPVRRVIRHGFVSVLSLGAFGGAWLLRGGVAAAVPTAALALELVGFALLGVAGFLGGSLVLHDRLGVDE
jgi:uncharacterized membrane protein